MKRVPLVVALAATLLVTGCGGGDDADSSSPSAKPTASAKPLTEAQLTTALVTQADLPAGYTPDTSGEDDDDIEFKASTPQCQEKYAVLDALDEDEAVQAEVEFQKGEGEASLSQSWEVVDGSLAQLKLEFVTVRSLFKDCPTVSLISKDGTPPINLTFSSLELPKLGDDSLGLMARGEIQGISIRLAFAFVRVDHNMQTVFQGGVGDPDVALLEKVATLGVQRLPKA